MSNVIEIVDSLQDKLEMLLSKYELLQVENKQLIEKSQKLMQDVKEHQESIMSVESKYNSLKFAKAMVGSKEDKHDTKLKINTLIREIDKCIAQLDE